jgi:hypothetical protein
MDIAFSGTVPHLREAAGDWLIATRAIAMNARRDATKVQARRGNLRLGLILLAVAVAFFVGGFISRML